MSKGKSWAIFAACAVVATGNLVRAEATPASDFTLSKPASMQAEPARKPLMWLLDQGNLAKPLEDAGINIGGYVEAGTTFYADRSHADAIQPGRTFDGEDQDPTLNAITLFAERTVDLAKHEWDLGFRVEGTWGGDARFIHSTGLGDYQDSDEQWDVIQAYGVIATPWDWKFTVGKFITPAGYETINSTTTPLYSRGLLFNNFLPFTHTGVVATYVMGDWTFDGGVIRGWDDSLEDKNNDGLSYLGRVSYAFSDKKTNLYVTGIFGPEFADAAHGGFPHANHDNRLLLDAVLTHKWSDEWSFAFEGDAIWETDEDGNVPGSTSSHDGFAYGAGAWATWTMSEMFQTNFRVEYVYDPSGIRFPVAAPPDGDSAQSASATVGWTITPFPKDQIGSNLKIRPELRADYCDEHIFGGAEDNWQFSAGISGYFTF